MISALSNGRTLFCGLMLSASCVALAGCGRIPGRPAPGPEVLRPDQVLGFPTLYKQNCAGCHGENGRNGAAISLANPVYIELAGETRLRNTIANGVPGKLMPAFAQSAGGMLTDQQVAVLAQGIVSAMGNAQRCWPVKILRLIRPLLPGNAEHGLAAYAAFCARCHGAAGEGGPADGKCRQRNDQGRLRLDRRSVVSRADQRPESAQHHSSPAGPTKPCPIGARDAAQPMTDQQVTDILAWLASKRVANPGQPYPSRLLSDGTQSSANDCRE